MTQSEVSLEYTPVLSLYGTQHTAWPHHAVCVCVRVQRPSGYSSTKITPRRLNVLYNILILLLSITSLLLVFIFAVTSHSLVLSLFLLPFLSQPCSCPRAAPIGGINLHDFPSDMSPDVVCHCVSVWCVRGWLSVGAHRAMKLMELWSARSTVVEGLAPLLHGKKIPGWNLQSFLSVGSLHVLWAGFPPGPTVQTWAFYMIMEVLCLLCECGSEWWCEAWSR